MVKNDQKWPKIEISGEWWEDGAAIAWKSFLFVDFIATAPSVNIFVNKNGDVIKRLPMSRHKWRKMAKYNQ